MKLASTLTILSILTFTQAGFAAAGGTNIGGGNNGSEYVALWCKNQLSVLRNYQDRAELKVASTGDYKLANKILTDGMVFALTSFKGEYNSFLAKSLTRGLDISRNLEGDPSKYNEKKGMVTNNVLTSYYSFMLEVVAKDLDLGASLPYAGASKEQMDERAAHFEEMFVTYAKSQLDWIILTLTLDVKLGDNLIYVPVGDAKSVVKVALILIEGTLNDLDDSLWNYRFSCAIFDLNTLKESMSLYDQGNREMFDDEKIAIDYMGNEINRISRSLSRKSSCN